MLTLRIFLSYLLDVIWIGVVVVSILTGAFMGIFGIPPVFQPVHLLLSVLILGIQFVLYMMLNPALVYRGLDQGKK